MSQVIPIRSPVLPAPHLYLHSSLLTLSPTHATISLPPLSHKPTTLTIPYQYLVYALGGSLPPPIDLSKGDGTKETGLKRLRAERDKIESLGKGGRVLVIGGGALGIQFATDVKEVWGDDRKVIMLHSRERLLPRFGERMHIESELQRSVFLSEREGLPNSES